MYDIRKGISGYFNAYSMLKRGGTFELLRHIKTTQEDLRTREADYMKEYNSYCAYIIINNQYDKE